MSQRKSGGHIDVLSLGMEMGDLPKEFGVAWTVKIFLIPLDFIIECYNIYYPDIE